MFDVSNRDSFNNIDKWFRNLYNENKKIKTILIGNKIDLKRTITYDEGKTKANYIEASYIEISSKTNKGIINIKNEIIKLVKSIDNRIKGNYIDFEDNNNNLLCLNGCYIV